MATTNAFRIEIIYSCISSVNNVMQLKDKLDDHNTEDLNFWVRIQEKLGCFTYGKEAPTGAS